MIRRPLWPIFLSSSAHSGTYRAPPTGVLLCSSVYRAFNGPASIVQLLMLACGGTEAMVMAPSPTCDSAVSPCFHGCLAFPINISSLTSPQSASLQSTAALTLGLLHNPTNSSLAGVAKLQLLATVFSREPVFLSGVCMAMARTV